VTNLLRSVGRIHCRHDHRHIIFTLGVHNIASSLALRCSCLSCPVVLHYTHILDVLDPALHTANTVFHI
jgi:hypothetical protein